jgi:hypothetical protein
VPRVQNVSNAGRRVADTFCQTIWRDAHRFQKGQSQHLAGMYSFQQFIAFHNLLSPTQDYGE